VDKLQKTLLTNEEMIRLMVAEAIRLGADGEDSTGVIREIVERHRLGFNAWLCVCIDVAKQVKTARVK